MCSSPPHTLNSVLMASIRHGCFCSENHSGLNTSVRTRHANKRRGRRTRVSRIYFSACGCWPGDGGQQEKVTAKWLPLKLQAFITTLFWTFGRKSLIGFMHPTRTLPLQGAVGRSGTFSPPRGNSFTLEGWSVASIFLSKDSLPVLVMQPLVVCVPLCFKWDDAKATKLNVTKIGGAV